MTAALPEANVVASLLKLANDDAPMLRWSVAWHDIVANRHRVETIVTAFLMHAS